MCYFLNTTVHHPTHLGGLDVGSIPFVPNLRVVSQFATWIYIDTLILKGNIMAWLLLLFRQFLYTILLLSASHILYIAFGAHFDACRCSLPILILLVDLMDAMLLLFFLFPATTIVIIILVSVKKKEIMFLSPCWPNRYGCNALFWFIYGIDKIFMK